ncbi:MAG TPA: hypothetical protein VKG83_16895 [Mycobacterium sp.]|nr:hypothetical protein [Mycobacterium sp.]
MADAAGWFALGGAAIGVAPATVKAFLDWRTAKADREHQQTFKLRDERRELIDKWRSRLAQSHADYRRWLVEKYKDVPPRTTIVEPDKPLGASDAPDAVGSDWFASLRAHLSETGEAAEYQNAVQLHCDNMTVRTLQNEIGRIEKHWLG